MTSEFISSPASPPASGNEWTLLATGDFAVELSSSSSLSEPEFQSLLSSDVRALFASASASIANLEAPLAAESPAIPKVGPTIALDPRSINLLSDLPVKVATLANNHAMDFDSAGLEKTLRACHAAGVLTTGAGADLSQALAPARFSIGDVHVSVLSFCEAEFGIASENSPGTAGISHPSALAAVTEERRQADVVIVAAHGGIEFFPLSPVQRARQLRSFIDAGADCVIGNHPHVPQAWEFYKSGLIFHSLGNFLFQLNSPANPRARWSLLPRLRFRGRTLLGFDAIPAVLDLAGRVTLPADGQPRIDYLKKISALLTDSECSEQLWFAAATQLWNDRYRRLLATAQGSLPGRLRRLLHRLRSAEDHLSAAQWRKLLLLNLFRAESHRWTIESALAAALLPPSPHHAEQLRALLEPPELFVK